jgi:predicted AlkP superfamily pyrophosphatase or phosphodiesterase
MPAPATKLAVLQVAALGWDFYRRHLAQAGLPPLHPLGTVFPAVTCTVQASVRTASAPSAHGMVANGLFFRDLKKVLFWEQAASLVTGPRIWDRMRAEDRRKVGLMFWQQSLGESVDLVLSPRPIHKHAGGMIQDCLSRPEPLYADLAGALKRGFNLMHYWGPLASGKSSAWIIDALARTMAVEAPDVLFGYLPHLDYDLQRYGPDSRKAAAAAASLAVQVRTFVSACARHGYDYVIYGDYEIGPVKRGPVFPNRRLRDAGLFRTRSVRGMLYPDFFHYEAFAMVDHEIAHVYVADPGKIDFIRRSFTGLPGVAKVWTREEAAAVGLDHARSGELILLAEPGAWFAYPWWEHRHEAPDYATHIDIHNKPGFDPCELFFGWPPGSVSTNPARVRGTHGRTGRVAWGTSLPDNPVLSDQVELGAWLSRWRPRW